MFISLLVVTFIIALLVAAAVARIFDGSIRKIMDRIIRDEISGAWHRYLKFAIIVVGLSGGVRLWEIERYLPQPGDPKHQLILDENRWVLEVYRTILGTVESVAWMLLVFFLVALIAYIIVRGQERRAAASE